MPLENDTPGLLIRSLLIYQISQHIIAIAMHHKDLVAKESSLSDLNRYQIFAKNEGLGI